MPRLARVVIPGVPHHVTQRGNYRQPVFLDSEDYRRYLDLLASAIKETGVELLAWCLMPNHGHSVMVPPDEEALARTMDLVQGRYAQDVHRRTGRVGHLWQGRYFSCPMDDEHVVAAVRYVELNPVRAGLVSNAWEYPWSSASDHMFGRYGGLLHRSPLLAHLRDWRAFLETSAGDDFESAIRRATATGRPAGSEEFCARLEQKLGRPMSFRPPGRPRKAS